MKNFKNEKAVSPVIGVILMVVITVIIAAILAVFAFGMGAPTKAPQTSIKATSAILDTATSNPDTVTLENQGGDPLRLSEVKLIIEQTDAAGLITRAYYDTAGAATNKYQAGDKLVIQTKTPAVGGITLNGVATVATIPTASGSVVIAAGSTITVSVIDIPSDQIITKATIRT